MDAGSDASHSASLRLAKQSLRGRVLALRDELAPPLRAAEGRAIDARIRSLSSFARAQCILVTLPFRSEWDTRPLVDAALRDGKRVAVPRVDREARVLRLHAIDDVDRDIVAGYVGTPEPRPTLAIVQPADVDWVLVPGVAFDARCRRLGYGGGFFDRLLPSIAGTSPKIAGAFEVQIVDEVPAGPLDHRVDAVVTPTLLLGDPR